MLHSPETDANALQMASPPPLKDIPYEMVYVFMTAHVQATYPANLTLLRLDTLIIGLLGEDYKF